MRVLVGGPVGLVALLWSVWTLSVAAEQVRLPSAAGDFGSIAEKFREYEVIVEPPVDAPEWWAGAPSVCRDSEGVFWLACRMRTADSPRGLRGYELRILRAEDGIRFEEVKRIHRDDVPIPGFERPSLLIDPETGLFKLYACGPWRGGPWGIIKFDDVRDPADFDPTSARLVIGPIEKTHERDIRPLEYKDPVIFHAEGRYHAFVIGYLRRNERIYRFTSADGESWEPAGDYRKSVMDLGGWHDFFVRPASVLPLGVGYLFVYEGSSANWHDPVYNIGTGLAFTFDLERMINLTPRHPLAVSSTPSPRFATFRYSDWLWVDGEIWVYAEVTRPNESHEIRLFRLGRDAP